MRAVPYHFSPAERQRVLDHILARLQHDERVVGIVLVGSGAEGFDDVYDETLGLDLAQRFEAKIWDAVPGHD